MFENFAEVLVNELADKTGPATMNEHATNLWKRFFALIKGEIYP